MTPVTLRQIVLRTHCETFQSFGISWTFYCPLTEVCGDVAVQHLAQPRTALRQSGASPGVLAPVSSHLVNDHVDVDLINIRCIKGRQGVHTIFYGVDLHRGKRLFALFIWSVGDASLSSSSTGPIDKSPFATNSA